MDTDQRISDLETRLARMEKLLEVVIGMAEKHPLSSKFVKKIRCELQRSS